MCVQSCVCYKERLLLVGSKRLSSLLETLEVLDSLDTELQRSILIAHDHGVLVHLERRHGPHVVDTLLNTLGEGKGLVATINDDNHLAGVQNGAHTNGQRRLRDLVDIVVEETTVRHNRVVGLPMTIYDNAVRGSSHGCAKREKSRAR